jgi:hypothetical protein
MTNCNFNPNECSPECKKYPICSFYRIQTQINNIQSQINFIYDTVSKILKTNETADFKIQLLESAVYKYINDSETISLIKESSNEEKN